MKKRLSFISLVIIFLTACSSSGPTVEKQVTSMPQTPYPTYTLFPTYTSFPPTPYPTKIQSSEQFSVSLAPDTGTSLSFTDEMGTAEIVLDFPKGVTNLQSAKVLLNPYLASDYPPTLVYSGIAFILRLGNDTVGYKNASLNTPVPVTIKFYNISQPIETLFLYYWTGSEWEKVETVCNLPSPLLDSSNGIMKTSICSIGAYAIFSSAK